MMISDLEKWLRNKTWYWWLYVGLTLSILMIGFGTLFEELAYNSDGIQVAGILIFTVFFSIIIGVEKLFGDEELETERNWKEK